MDAVAADNLNQTESLPDDIASVDVTPYVPQKVAALAAHQTQFPFKSDLLPPPILRELFGYEYFVPVYS